MPEIIQTYMAPNEFSESITSESASQPAEQPSSPEASSASSNSGTHRSGHSGSHHSHRSVSHHAGSHRSSSSTKHKPRKPKKRNSYPAYRVSFWSRISAPLLQCRRCGERYRTSWSKDTRCPKCGRYPMKIQPWEGALYTLFFPAAIIGSMVHYGRSPRNAAIIFCIGLVGLLVETTIYFVAR